MHYRFAIFGTSCLTIGRARWPQVCTLPGEMALVQALAGSSSVQLRGRGLFVCLFVCLCVCLFCLFVSVCLFVCSFGWLMGI